MRVAVLGSTSFAGRDFVDLALTAGHEVLGIGRSADQGHTSEQYVYRRCDLNDDAAACRAALDTFEPQFIVNFAAQGDDAASWRHPQDFFQTNCVALAGLIDHLKERRYVRRFLQVSSSSVYGNPRGSITEESPLQPESPYAVSKAAADLLLLAYYRSFEFPAQVIRPPNLYGPHQQLFRVIPKAITMLKRGEQIELHGGGNAIRSYLYVRDMSRAALAIVERGPAGRVYNVSPDEKHRIRDIIAMICELLGKDVHAVAREVDDRRGQSSAQDLDSTRIRRELGWHAQIALRTGIEEVRSWIERDWDDLARQPTDYAHRR